MKVVAEVTRECKDDGRQTADKQMSTELKKKKKTQKKPGITNEAIVLSNLTSEQPPTNMQEVWFHFWYSNINTNKLQ